MNLRNLSVLILLGLILSSCQSDPGIKLFNGKDLSSWELVSFDPEVAAEDIWSVEDGVIRATGDPHGYILTKESYGNYKLHVEWRWAAEPTNSGVLLHVQEKNMKEWPLCIEAQLQNGKAGDILLIGAGSGVTVKDSIHAILPDENRYEVIAKFEKSSELGSGEWNSYDITCSGSDIELVVNGVLQNVGSSAAFTSGPIALQSEGSPIEFRNVYLVPLED